jgi:hypothetical protein
MTPKTPISNSDSYRDVGAFWDNHDATETGGQEEVTFDVAIASQRRYLAVEGSLSERVRRAADRRGISEQDLIQQWLEEKLEQDQDLGRQP